MCDKSKEYDRYDKIVATAMGHYMEMKTRLNYIAIRGVNIKNEASLAAFHIAAMTASICNVPCYVEMNVINWLKLKWLLKKNKTKVAFKRLSFAKSEYKEPEPVAVFINSMLMFDPNTKNIEDFEEIYRTYYSGANHAEN